MGYYINENSKGEFLGHKTKAEKLIEDGTVKTDATFKSDLVCVLHGDLFDAANYVYYEREFEVINDLRDMRPKTWLVYSHAKELSGYKSLNIL